MATEKMAYKLLINVGGAKTSETQNLSAGKTARIKAQAGVRYQLQDANKNDAPPEQVRVKRVGKDLHVALGEGEEAAQLIIEDYYSVMPEGFNALVGQTEGGSFYEYVLEAPTADSYTLSLTDGQDFTSAVLGAGEVSGSGAALAVLAFNPLLAAGAAAGAAGAAAAAGGGGAAAAAPAATVVDTTPPAAPVLNAEDRDANGRINASGTAEIGSTVTVTWPDGTTSTATAGPDGTWTIESPTVQPAGNVRAEATDASGNRSDPATVVFSDVFRVVISPEGVVTGAGATPGQTVTASLPNGSSVTAVVGPNGTFTLPAFSPVPANGETVSVSTPTGVAGQPAETGTTVAPNTTAITASISPEGVVTGSGATPGQVVTATLPNGATVTAVAGANGTFTLPAFAPVPANGETVSISAPTGVAGQNPETGTTVAPNTTGITASISPEGVVTGSGATPGQTVTATLPNGATVTAVAGANGTFTLPAFAPVPANGETVSVSAPTSAGQPAETATTLAPNTTGITASIDGNGVVSGSGATPGQTVTATLPNGATVTAVAGANGTFTLPAFAPVPANGETVSVSAPTGVAGQTAETGTTVAPNTGITASIDSSGVVTGSGATPGKVVTATLPNGATATGTAGTGGSFTLSAFDPVPANGETVSISAPSGVAGQPAETGTTAAPNTTGITASISPEGVVTGSGATPGQVVTATLPNGATATGTAGVNGTFTLTGFDPVPANGETVSISAPTGVAGQNPETASALAPNTQGMTASISPEGVVTGSGATPGQTVTATLPNGATVTAVAGANGTFTLPAFAPVPANGETVSVSAPTSAGQSAETATTVAPNTTGITASIDANGVVTGTGATPGQVVTATLPNGATATGTAGVNGTFTLTAFDPVPANGETVSISAPTGVVGQNPETASALAPNTTGITASIDASGVVTGSGATPGQVVTATLPNGATATGTAGKDGSFTLSAFDPVPANGETVSISAPTSAGQPAETATTLAPNTTGITASISPEGVVSGSGATPGQVVTATLPNGATATGTAGVNGTFTLTAFDPVPANGETVSISAPTGVAGQNPETASALAPNTTGITASIDSNGVVTGSGATPGQVVTATLPNGTTATGTAESDGTFTLSAFDPVPANGETVSISAPTGVVGQNPETGTTVAPNTTGITASIDALGVVTGSGATPGQVVTATLPNGATATGTAGTDGSFTLSAFDPIPANGETVSISAPTSAGQPLETATTLAPNTTGITASIDSSGVVTGSGATPGQVVTATLPNGATATGTAGVNGTFTLNAFDPVPANGETVSVSAPTGVAGQNPETASALAPNTTGITASIDANGVVTGTGATPGQVVTATLPNGATATGTAGSNGTFTLPAFEPAPANGETVNVSAPTGVAGQNPETASALAPNTTGITASIDSNGVVTGTGATPGQVVTATLPNGATATGTAGVNGTFTLSAFDPVPANGETVSVSAPTGVAGQNPETASALAPNTQGITASISTEGVVTGSGATPGQTVTATLPNGATVTAVAGANGTFTLPAFAPVPANGETVSVSAPTSAGQSAETATTVAPNTTGITASIDANGVVTGTGATPGQVVTATLPNGATATGTAGVNGTFTLSAFDPVPANGETVQVSAPTGVVGQPAETASALAPNTTGITASISPEGVVTGSGATPGQLVTATLPNGATATGTAGVNGTFTLSAFDPVPANGETVSISAATGVVGQNPETASTLAPNTKGITASIDASGVVTGSGATPGQVVTATLPNGATATGTAGTDGSFTLSAFDPVPANGETVSVSAPTSAGQPAETATTLAPNTTGITASISPEGVVSGSGATPGQVVTATLPNGATATGTAGVNGTFTLTAFDPVPANGETVSVSAPTGVAGQNPETASALAPNTTGITASIDANGVVTGTGATPGQVVTATLPNGATATGTAGTDGSFTLSTFDPVPANGETVSISAPTSAGQPSETATTLAPNTTGITASIDSNGVVTGSGATPGQVVTATLPNGTTATGTAESDGTFTLTAFDPVPANGETVSISAPTGVVGQNPETATTVAPNTTGITASIDSNGVVTGTGATPGQVVTATLPNGATATGTAGSNGTFTLSAFDPVPANGETVSVSAPTGVAGQNPETASALAPNTTGITASIDSNGVVTGTGATPGQVVTATLPNGATATGTAGSNGTFTLTAFDPVPANGETVSVSAPTGVAGQNPETASTLAPNTTGITASIDSSGVVTGTGATPGQVVTATLPNGATATGTAGVNGSFTLTAFDPVPANGETVSVSAPTGVAGQNPETASTLAPNTTGITASIDSSGVVTGTGATPGQVVTATLPNGATATGTAGVNGTFTLSAFDPVPANGETVSVSAPTGVVGQNPETGTTVAPNTTGITASIDANGVVTGTGATPGQVVTATLPNGATATGTAGVNGTFTLSAFDPVPANGETVSISAPTGVAGQNPETATTVAPDTTPPSVAINEPVTQNANGTLTVSGTGEIGATVVVKDVNNVTIGTTTIVANGQGVGVWTVTSNGPVVEGTLKATATDISNQSASDTAPYTDDTPPPKPTVWAVDSDHDGKINASGTAEPFSTVTVTWPDNTSTQTQTDSSGNWAVESPTVQQRGYVQAVQMDINGKVGDSTNTQYHTVTNLSVVDTDGDGKPTVSGETSPYQLVTIIDPSGTPHEVTAGEDGKFSFEIDPAPNQLTGEYTATVSWPGPNGSTYTSTPATVNATDLTAPVITGVDVGDANADGKPTISGHVDTPSLVVTIVDPAGATHTTMAGQDGIFSLEIVVAQGFVDGTYKVTAKDAAGNVSAPEFKDYITSVPLDVATVAQNADGTLTVSGTGQIGATVVVKDASDDEIGTATIVDNGQGVGTWTVTSTGEVPEGTLSASATVGNNAPSTDTAFYENKPVAVDDLGSGTEDSTSLTGNVSTNDTHKDGSEVFTLDSSATGTYGSLVLGTGGAWTYTRNNTNLNAITVAAEDSFTYKVTDGEGNQSTAILTIKLDPVNDAPVAARTSTGFVEYLENAQPALAFLTPLSFTDVDSANFSSATVKVGSTATGHPFMAGDVLSCTVPSGSDIQASYNPATGVLTLTGVATKAEYKAILDTVLYSNTSDDTQNGTRRISWRVTDENGLQSAGGTTADTFVTFKRVNDAPVLDAGVDVVMPNVQPSTTELPQGAMPTGQVGVLVSSLLSGSTDPDGNFLNVFKGIAVVGVNKALGELYFSLDGGLNWYSYGSTNTLSEQNALLLKVSPSARVYFRPHAGVEGYIADAFTFRSWDASESPGLVSLNGVQVTTYPINATGGTSAFSIATDTVALTVATVATSGHAGTAGDDVMAGTAGNDVMVANGGADQISAGDGNDKVVLNASNVAALSASNTANVDGGTGINTLTLSGKGMLLDLSDPTVQGKVHNFSTIDITGNGYNTLQLALSDVQTLSGSADNASTTDVNEAQMLVVKGNDGDAVVLENTAGWSQVISLRGADLTNLFGADHGFVTDRLYTQYSQSGATLFVDELTAVADKVGTAGTNVLNGTANADVIFGNGGADTITAGDGNDKVILNGRVISDLGGNVGVSIDGGAGVNTLSIFGRNLSLDLSNATVAGKVDKFSVLDLQQGVGNQVKISLNEVLNMSGASDNSNTAIDESKMLVVQGNGTNAVNTLTLVDGSSWDVVENLGGTTMINTYGAEYGFVVGRSYSQYTNGMANLFVDQTLIREIL